MREVKLQGAWKDLLQKEFQAPYMQQLSAFLRQELKHGKVIYPPGPLMFSALETTPPEKVRVVIIGQDPYHGPGQAHGLSFSVPQGVQPPPSLKNIFQEINADLGLNVDGSSGHLIGWAKQGVLLLNSVLSVEQSRAGSHQGKGWEQFTDAVVACLNEQFEHLVFMLWGSYAQEKGAMLDRQKHLVLSAPHPSPLSAHRGFLGCKHFSQANQYLSQMGHDAIDWSRIN